MANKKKKPSSVRRESRFIAYDVKRMVRERGKRQEISILVARLHWVFLFLLSLSLPAKILNRSLDDR